MCGTRLAENAGPKKVAKKCHLGTIARLRAFWHRLAGLGHPSKFQRVSRLGSVTAQHSSTGRQPNFAALKRGRHLCSAGRPSRWALAHISSSQIFGLPSSLRTDSTDFTTGLFLRSISIFLFLASLLFFSAKPTTSTYHAVSILRQPLQRQ